MKELHISLLVCVVPSFGIFIQFFSQCVKSIAYGNFLMRIAEVCRENICHEDTDIVFINDNAMIHKAKTINGMEEE